MTELNKLRIGDGAGVMCFPMSFERDTRPETVTAPFAFGLGASSAGADEEEMMALDAWMIQ